MPTLLGRVTGGGGEEVGHHLHWDPGWYKHHHAQAAVPAARFQGVVGMGGGGHTLEFSWNLAA